ncbi:MAG: single-stranded DNA-binding protein [Ruminococcus sp.]|jgi:single-strand DNA-binding protein|nr:single-stranded DNA-binding protein [Ruminococcus sp.]
MNKVILMGRLTADPDLRQTTSGIASCRFTIAVNRRFTDKNTGERQADFISCTAWRQTAEFISRYFKKGSMICVEGTLRTGSYTDKKYSDVTHYTTDVLVDNAEFTGSKSDSQGGNANYSAPSNNNYNYQAPAPSQTAPASAQPAPSNDSLSFGDLGDFEEILGDGDVPF